MVDKETANLSDAQMLASLLVINTITLAAAYALNSNTSNVRNLVAAAVLVIAVVVETALCRPFRPILSWVLTIPVAIAMAFLIGAHPSLDWSGPCEADQMCLAPIIPIVGVFYTLGFAFAVGAIRWALTALRDHVQAGKS